MGRGQILAVDLGDLLAHHGNPRRLQTAIRATGHRVALKLTQQMGHRALRRQIVLRRLRIGGQTRDGAPHAQDQKLAW